MSKFCGNCGTMMDDNAVVCGNCGNPLAAAAPATAEKANPVTDIICGIKKGDKQSLIKGGIAVVALVVVIVLISSLFSGGSDKVVKKLIKAYDNEKASAIVKLVVPYTRDMFEEMDEDFKEEIEDEIKDFYEAMEEELDTDKLSFKYEIEDKEERDKDDVEDFAEQIEWACDMYDVKFDADKIKAIVDYEVEVTVKGGGEKEKVDLYVSVIKYGGKWYIASYEWDY